VPGVFELIASAGVEAAEMRRTFNNGLGMIVAVPAAEADQAIAALEGAGEKAYLVGDVLAGKPGEVVFAGA
jgi:phosphoribosylformylglycinamidine cyclo-ligase